MMHVVIGNYGDATIALLQWLYDARVQSVYVISVLTGWEASGWSDRVDQGENFARQCGFTPVRLQAPHGFKELVRDRKSFPSPKFSWCVSLLKASPILTWLLVHDPANQATIVLGKRRSTLAEYECSEHYDNRQVWYPLYQHSEADWHALIQKAGFDVLGHRSLECRVCIHSKQIERNKLTVKDSVELAELEEAIGKQWLFNEVWSREEDELYLRESFANSCGNEYACGD